MIDKFELKHGKILKAYVNIIQSNYIVAMFLQFRICLLITIFYSCTTSKSIISTPNSSTRSFVIMYDQNVREFPLKNPTNMVIPGIFLPLQQKAFQLDRTEEWDRKILILQFPDSDDSSLIQIMANRFGYKNWLYTDTLLDIKNLPGIVTCFKLEISTNRNKDFGLVPQLKVIPITCKEINLDFNRDRYLIYDVATQSISGTEKRIFRKRGYNALFKRPLIPRSSVIKVSDIPPDF